MRIFIRTSRFAVWARRLGTFGVPLLALSILLHVFGQISTTVFEVCLALATLAGGLAVLLAFVSYVRLWFTGDKGWGLASMGLATGLICLVPACAAVALMAVYPSSADVSTYPRNPPELVFPRASAPEPIDPDLALETFPNLLTRTYRLDPPTLFGLAHEIVERSGWQIMRSQAPQPGTAVGRLNAIRKSLLGWSDEFALRVESASLGSRIDVRGASLRDVPHDLGSNGRVLEDFLVALDQTVARYLRENVDTGEDEEDTGGSEPEPLIQ